MNLTKEERELCKRMDIDEKGFPGRVDWDYISEYQKLSEEFIAKHADRVNWWRISIYQKLSEEFIEKHAGRVDWACISEYQKLSEEFIDKHKDKINIEVQKRKHKTKTLKQKEEEVRKYAKRHKLKYKGGYLYAYREHDEWGRGMFNKAISYEKGKYYKDWHCDMDRDDENSFGDGIFPKGNTKVRIKVEDWGVAVNRKDGKARVWGFEIV